MADIQVFCTACGTKNVFSDIYNEAYCCKCGKLINYSNMKNTNKNEQKNTKTDSKYDANSILNDMMKIMKSPDLLTDPSKVTEMVEKMSGNGAIDENMAGLLGILKSAGQMNLNAEEPFRNAPMSEKQYEDMENEINSKVNHNENKNDEQDITKNQTRNSRKLDF